MKTLYVTRCPNAAESEMPSPTEDTAGTQKGQTPVCAIGTSAGGVKALQQFFGSIDPHLGLAYVVILHLAPDHPSMLAEILASVTEMSIHEVDDTPELRPNCVYVIKPDRELVIHGNTIESRPFAEPRGLRAPIDGFFRSVAEARGDGFAVILTGAGSDGAAGVRKVKEGGGVVLVQDPMEAEFSMMPRSAQGLASWRNSRLAGSRTYVSVSLSYIQSAITLVVAS